MHVEARQGDVALLKLDAEEVIPSVALTIPRDNGDVILAYGEVTGHAHRIHEETAVMSKVVLSDSIEEYLHVMEEGGPVSLVHDEHATLTIPPAVYAILHQEEYVPGDVPTFTYVRD